MDEQRKELQGQSSAFGRKLDGKKAVISEVNESIGELELLLENAANEKYKVCQHPLLN